MIGVPREILEVTHPCGTMNHAAHRCTLHTARASCRGVRRDAEAELHAAPAGEPRPDAARRRRRFLAVLPRDCGSTRATTCPDGHGRSRARGKMSRRHSERASVRSGRRRLALSLPSPIRVRRKLRNCLTLRRVPWLFEAADRWFEASRAWQIRAMQLVEGGSS
jgi:hypothetical protein